MKYSALIGNPVEHSCSPTLFAYLGKISNMEYSHIKIKVDSKDNLKHVIDSLNDLGFCGINVTCPYKVDCFSLVDKVDDSCKNVGSVNTIKKIGNNIVGFNTDGIAGINSICEIRKITSNDKVVIFGAGGVARSIVYEISRLTKNITIFNINKKETQQMLNFLGNCFDSFDLSDRIVIERYLKDASLVINCTSVGMKPDINNSIITEKEIRKCENKNCVFFDVVFNPWETKFIKYAKKYGFSTVCGGKMLINQAILAFQIWTGILLDVKKINFQELEKILTNEINGK